MTLLFTRAFYRFHLFSLSKVAPTKAKLCITLCTSILIECFVDKVLPISIISDFLKVFGLALIFWWLTKVRADRKISRLVQMVTLENGPLWFMWSFCPSFITLSSRNEKEKHGHGNSKWDLGVCQRVTLKRIDDYCNVLAKRVLAMISFLVSWKTNTDVCWVYCRISMYAKRVFW